MSSFAIVPGPTKQLHKEMDGVAGRAPAMEPELVIRSGRWRQVGLIPHERAAHFQGAEPKLNYRVKRAKKNKALVEIMES